MIEAVPVLRLLGNINFVGRVEHPCAGCVRYAQSGKLLLKEMFQALLQMDCHSGHGVSTHRLAAGGDAIPGVCPNLKGTDPFD
eukprot:5981909-Amphidinium_carterae.2